MILSVPDAPVNLQNAVELTAAKQIGLTWEEGPNNGGTSVIYYEIWTD